MKKQNTVHSDEQHFAFLYTIKLNRKY